MTRALAITKRQTKTLIRAAKEEGAVIEVETEIGWVRIIPADLAKALTERKPVDTDEKWTM